MRYRRLTTALAGATVAVSLTASPVSAGVTSGYFACGNNLVEAAVPGVDYSTGTIWWIPQVFSWNGSSWQHAAWGEYVYNNGGGAPHAWRAYSTHQYADRQTYPTNPAGFYAVRHWVYSDGAWDAEWAVLSGGDADDSTYWCRG